MLVKSKIYYLPVILIILISGINIFLQTLPLTNVLHYEFSAINGIFQSLFGGILAIYLIKNNSINKRIEFNVFKSDYKLLLFFTLSQFILAFISNIAFQICPISEGLFFYFVITIPSYLIGIITGIFAYSITQRFPYLIFSIIWFIILSAPIPELFANPQIYFFNPIIGFSPGTIYDEDITISLPLIFYRLLNLVFFVSLFYLLTSKRLFAVRYHKYLKILIFVIVALIFSLLKPALGFSTDTKRIKNVLKAQVETEHFIIFYPKELSPNEIKNLVFNHEYAYSELSNELNDKLNSKIISFVFKDGAQKGELFGSNNADVAKPWLNQIYVNYSNFRSSLQHELAHVFSAKYGNTFLKLADNFNPALIEGFATSLANNYDDNDIHFMARLAYQYNYRISIPSLFSGLNFFSQTSSISYIYAGSFMKYLKETYSVDKIKNLYGNLDFNMVFNKNISELESDYFDFLLGKNFFLNKNTADFYFGRKPIFKRFCARFVANKIRKGFELYKKKDFEKAEHVFTEVYEVSDSYQGLVGKLNSMVKLNENKEALEFIQNEIKKFEGTSYFFNLELVLSNLYVENKKIFKADSVFKKLIVQNPRVDYKNAALFRKYLLQEGDSSITIFNEAENDGKLKKVKIIIDKYKNMEFLPIYLSLLDNPDYLETKDYLKKSWEHISSANSLFEISKFAAENNDFEFAVECISEALKLNMNPNKAIIYRDYLKKYIWINNSRKEILSNMIISEN